MSTIKAASYKEVYRTDPLLRQFFFFVEDEKGFDGHRAFKVGTYHISSMQLPHSEES